MDKELRKKLIGGKFLNVSSTRSRLMSAVKGRGNKTTELKFRMALIRAGISGWKMHKKIIGNPDVFFPNYKIAVFLDGCFWHGCPRCGHIPKTNRAYWSAKIYKNKERDLKKAEALTKEGYIVVRFWEHELIGNISNCIERLVDLIENTLSHLSNSDDLLEHIYL